MPSIIDQLVISDVDYLTSGPGGRKIAITDNGIIFIALKKTNSYSIYKSLDGTNFSKIHSVGGYSSFQDISISCSNENVFILASISNNSIVSVVLDLVGNVIESKILTSATNPFGVSISINSDFTELHAFWVSNSDNTSTRNLHYSKGSINANKTITWSSVETWTSLDFNIEYLSTSVFENEPVAAISYGTTVKNVVVISSGLPLPSPPSSPILKRYKMIAGTTTSFVSSPSVDVGVVNGIRRLGLVFTKQNSSGIYQVESTFSNDSGVNWSAITDETNSSENCLYPYLAYDKNGKRFITYQNADMVRIKKDSSDSAIAIGTTYPNVAISSNISSNDPLVVYKKTNGIYFTGNWTAQKISPQPSDRGRILNRQNVLTYNITSDSTIGTVTEKINGVVVGTKALNSGQNTTINITQAQWDAIPYGKYQNNNAARNTIEIVTSAGTYKYTFEKWIDNTADILSSIKAVKDSKDYYLPSAKKILSDAINFKGGSTTSADSIESMANNITSALSNSKVSTSTMISSSDQKVFSFLQSGDISCYYVTVDTSIIGFYPDIIEANGQNTGEPIFSAYNKDGIYVDGAFFFDIFMNTSATNSRIGISIKNNSLIYIPVSKGSSQYKITCAKG